MAMVCGECGIGNGFCLILFLIFENTDKTLKVNQPKRLEEKDCFHCECCPTWRNFYRNTHAQREQELELQAEITRRQRRNEKLRNNREKNYRKKGHASVQRNTVTPGL